eukprot:NODE_8055_length_1526_cov_13.993567.p1 GENE.NODE_8055_length_1526_cov_13.993567~~NODE_8055_length_1526_cov_13.993567.p1  ORF type:complete len:344 (-),score=54.55 NODE_8055_length_1526_cov_13.993567:339-1370(-)
MGAQGQSRAGVEGVGPSPGGGLRAMAPTQPLCMKFVPCPGGGFPAAFEADPSGNFVMVCPGDEELFVGGGALNGAIGRILCEKAGHPIAFTPDADGKLVYDKEKCPYRPLHHGIFSRAHEDLTQGNEPALHHAALSELQATPLPLMYCGARTFNVDEHPFGVAILDIFGEGAARPLSQKNIGIMYTVGPLGVNKKAEGEGEVTAEREALVIKDAAAYCEFMYNTGRNLAATTVEYNKEFSGLNLPRIEVIRLPLVGGGTFLHPEVSKVEVALCLIWAFHHVFTSIPPEERAQVELMPSPEMQEAHARYMSGVILPELQVANFSKLPGQRSSSHVVCGIPCVLL